MYAKVSFQLCFENIMTYAGERLFKSTKATATTNPGSAAYALLHVREITRYEGD